MKRLVLLGIVFLNIAHSENTTIKVSYENLNFDNSKKKDDGKVYGVTLEHKTVDALYQVAYQRTNTDTFQPPLSDNLNVDKYYFKYT